MSFIQPRALTIHEIELLKCYGLRLLSTHLHMTPEQAALCAMYGDPPRFRDVQVTKELPIFGIPGKRFKTKDHERFIWNHKFKEPPYENAA